MNISKLSGWLRLGIIVSTIWLLGVFAGTNPLDYSGQWDDFIGMGLLPIIILWGIYWIIHGFKSTSSEMTKRALTDDSEYYLVVAKEMKEGPKDDASWMRAIELSNGNEAIAKSLYIKMRVEQLAILKKQRGNLDKKGIGAKKLPEENLRPQAPPDYLMDKFHRIVGDDAVTFTVYSDSFWICVCGKKNSYDPYKIQNCTNCHRNRDYCIENYSEEVFVARCKDTNRD